jgi:hypothetical protein
MTPHIYWPECGLKMADTSEKMEIERFQEMPPATVAAKTQKEESAGAANSSPNCHTDSVKTDYKWNQALCTQGGCHDRAV